MIIRKPITKPVMRSVLTSLSTAASEAASALAVPPSLRSLLFHDDGTATEYPAYYTEEEWAEHSHLLKDYSLGVGDLREKRLGYCYDFDGVDDYVEVLSFVDQAYSSGSFSFWFRAEAGQALNARFLEFGANTNRVGAFIEGGSKKLSLYIVGGGVNKVNILSNAAVNDAAWHHAVCTWSLEGAFTFIDGVEQSEAASSVTGLSITTGTPFFVSHFVGGSGYSLNGKISDVRIYNDALTADEVTYIYTNGQSGTDPGSDNLVAHYPLQEESGATAYDISGNGNHGTILNAVTSGVGSIHQPDAGVVKSYANDEGYRANGSVVIPAASATTAADGNPLTYTGRCPNYGLAKGPAWQGDGSAVYVDLGSPVIPASSDFTITIPYKHVGVSTQAVFSQTETAVTAGRMLVYANQPTANRLRFVYIDLGNTITIDLPVCLAVNEFHLITASRTGNALRITCEGSLGSFTDTESPTTLSVAQFNTHLLSYAGSSRSAGAAGPFAITVGGLTTTYSPIEGTRNVAVTRSDGTYAVIANAVKNGALATLYSDGDGSWQLPEIANGAHFDGTGLYPAAPGASVAANGNALNIPANKHPIGLLVDRTGGVAAPFDYQSGADGYTNEAFSDIPTEITLNKRGLSIYAADRYGAALEDIQS